MVSKKPRKQRQKWKNLPLHMKSKMIKAHLSKELREQLKMRSVRVRKGDKVRVMRGSFKGKEGTVVRVDVKRARVYVEGITRRKSDGSEILVPLHPSNLLVIELNMEDEKRFK